MKCRGVLDQMVGWHDEHDRRGIVLGDPQSRQSRGRRGIAPDRFEQDIAGLLAGQTQLLRNQESVVLVTDDDGRRYRNRFTVTRLL